MLPNPLHPAIVHFPVVLAFLLPISAVAAIWTIRKGARVTRAWAVPLAIAAALTLSSWAATETGEAQEEKVEKVVAEAPFEAHEEAAELFMTGSAAILLLTAGGLARGITGRIGRVAATAGALVLVAGGAYVGHTGGELVYQYGAASAYAPAGGAAPTESRNTISLTSNRGADHDKD